MARHRTIYEENFGPIPKDETGRSYEIHHIDGDKNNNSIDNLKCVSIQEHYDIHYRQGDWGACLIMSSRMDISAEEKSKLAKQRKHTKETKEKLRIANKMQFDNPELKEKHLRACYAKNANHTDKIWINKNGKNKRVTKENYKENFSDWNLGRIFKDGPKFYDFGNRKQCPKTGRFI